MRMECQGDPKYTRLSEVVGLPPPKPKPISFASASALDYQIISLLLTTCKTQKGSPALENINSLNNFKMKFYHGLMTVLGGLLLSVSMNAQTEMEWDTHGVGFTVPDDFKIETNNAEEFTADNGTLFLSILPIQDETITKDDLAEAVADIAIDLEYDRIQEGEAIDVDDFSGYYVKGRKDGVNAVIMALLDNESSTNLLVVIVYADGFEDDAVAVASSFYAYD